MSRRLGRPAGGRLSRRRRRQRLARRRRRHRDGLRRRDDPRRHRRRQPRRPRGSRPPVRRPGPAPPPRHQQRNWHWHWHWQPGPRQRRRHQPGRHQPGRHQPGRHRQHRRRHRPGLGRPGHHPRVGGPGAGDHRQGGRPGVGAGRAGELPAPPAAGARLAGPSLPLDVGVSRDIPAAIRRAVILRDQHCRWTGGCDQPAAACEVHHLTHKADGGKTSVKDTILFCTFHHQVMIHQMGWTVVLNPDGTTTALPASVCDRKRPISGFHGHDRRGRGMPESVPCSLIAAGSASRAGGSMGRAAPA